MGYAPGTAFDHSRGRHLSGYQPFVEPVYAISRPSWLQGRALILSKAAEAIDK